MSDKIKKTIDRMVEDSIRRILPGVMNEILVRTLAGSGALTESRPAPQKRKAPKKGRKPVREQSGAPKPQRGPKKLDLSDILDESAGSEFYDDPNVKTFHEEELEEMHEEEVQVRPDLRKALPAGLQHLAEDIAVDIDDDEMWGAGEHDSGALASAAAGPQIDRAARALDIDFSKMQGLLQKAAPAAAKSNPGDARAKAQFEAQRIKRMRESLNGGKPVE